MERDLIRSVQEAFGIEELPPFVPGEALPPLLSPGLSESARMPGTAATGGSMSRDLCILKVTMVVALH